MRTAQVSRQTAETEITVDINLDGTGAYDNQTGVGFFDHMLDQLSRHSLIDMTIRAKGDYHIDDHHTVEDTGIALGQALTQALGDKKGINRYGECHLPMDDAQVRCALDLSARKLEGLRVPGTLLAPLAPLAVQSLLAIGVHVLNGTPNLWLTVTPSIVFTAIYGYVYTFTLLRSAEPETPVDTGAA